LAPITIATFNIQGSEIATAASDGVIRFWSARGEPIAETPPAGDRIVAMAFSPKGKSLFIAFLGGTVTQVRVRDGKQIGNMIMLSEKMNSALAVAPSGTELAAACRDDFLHFWEIPTGKPLTFAVRHANPVITISYSRDGRFIATGCDDHTARIWSRGSGEQQGEPFYVPGRPSSVSFTANSKALLVGGVENDEVNCYDTKTHENLYHPLPHPTGVSHVTANASGSEVITVDNDGVARLWRIPTTSEPPPKWLPEYLRAIGGLAFSAQQQLVQVTTRERLELRKKLLAQPAENTVWDKLMRWSFEQNRSPAPDL